MARKGDESERKIEAVVHKLLSAKADPLKTPEMSALLVVEAVSADLFFDSFGFSSKRSASCAARRASHCQFLNL